MLVERELLRIIICGSGANIFCVRKDWKLQIAGI